MPMKMQELIKRRGTAWCKAKKRGHPEARKLLADAFDDIHIGDRDEAANKVVQAETLLADPKPTVAESNTALGKWAGKFMHTHGVRP